MKHDFGNGGPLDFSPRGWGRVMLWTVLGTLVCVTAALYVDSFNFERLSREDLTRAVLVDIFLPIGLAVPMLLFLTIKLRELAVAQFELARLASLDSLTSVLNRRAFTTLVEAYLTEIRARDSRGALLVVDADHFKCINDRFGHESGDEALKEIARAIKGMLRNTDIVGRIGGEEFAVFLPGSTAEQARSAAERIRSSIAETDFQPAGGRALLSVSVGGAAFDKRLSFAELFRIADQQLYLAKNAGRNRVAVTPVGQSETYRWQPGDSDGQPSSLARSSSDMSKLA
jgi:diguanylate cyclase (GGDEF)-like protein